MAYVSHHFQDHPDLFLTNNRTDSAMSMSVVLPSILLVLGAAIAIRFYLSSGELVYVDTTVRI
jgi:hypothetical protein